MRVRKPVALPDGRYLYGRWPQSMPRTGEGPYIADLARAVNGACEVTLPVGRADVANGTTVFEVEPARQWRTGMRQVLGYAGQTGLAPALALFGEADYLPIYLFIRDRLPNVRLWIFRGRWVATTSRREAAIKWHPSQMIVPPPADDLDE